MSIPSVLEKDATKPSSSDNVKNAGKPIMAASLARKPIRKPIWKFANQRLPHPPTMFHPLNYLIPPSSKCYTAKMHPELHPVPMPTNSSISDHMLSYSRLGQSKDPKYKNIKPVRLSCRFKTAVVHIHLNVDVLYLICKTSMFPSF